MNIETIVKKVRKIIIDRTRKDYNLKNEELWLPEDEDLVLTPEGQEILSQEVSKYLKRTAL